MRCLFYKSILHVANLTSIYPLRFTLIHFFSVFFWNTLCTLPRAFLLLHLPAFLHIRESVLNIAWEKSLITCFHEYIFPRFLQSNSSPAVKKFTLFSSLFISLNYLCLYHFFSRLNRKVSTFSDDSNSSIERKEKALSASHTNVVITVSSSFGVVFVVGVIV